MDDADWTWARNWVLIAIVVVVAQDIGAKPIKHGKQVVGMVPGPSGVLLRYTLLAIVAYVLLTNYEPVQRGVTRFVSELDGVRPHSNAFDRAHRA